MNPFSQSPFATATRRQFLGATGKFSLGAIALQSLLAQDAAGSLAADPLSARVPHYQPRAKRVIYLHMSGGPPTFLVSSPLTNSA